jgi:hypothetical protein
MKNLQAPGSKRQKNPKQQAPNITLRPGGWLKIGIWSFSGVWSLELGAL